MARARPLLFGLVSIVCVSSMSAWSQTAGRAGEIARGHQLALEICANCHVAARDQPHEPILRPPALPFESIAARSDVTAESLRKFLSATHRDPAHPHKMPDPMLVDYQIRELAQYILSLRK